MRKIRLIVEYDGTDFVGWQRQDNGASVQAALEEALRRLTGSETPVRAAGRTDAGVHATGQVVSFSTESPLPPYVFVRGVNAHLPTSIAVQDAAEMPEDFDARHSASGKLYRYQIWNALPRSPLRGRTHWHVRHALDPSAMAAAATLLTGRHDFAAFRAADCERKTTVRTMRRLEIRQPEPQVLHIDVEGTAFLKNMVRILAGTLVDVGRSKRGLTDVQDALRDGDRRRAGPTAPPHGLVLCRVDYGERTGV